MKIGHFRPRSVWRALNRPAFRRKKRRAAGFVVAWLLGLLRCMSGMRALTCVERSLLKKLVIRSQLFDSDWYKANNPEAAVAAGDALDHYVARGDAEGRSPMPLFDPEYYRRAAGCGPCCPNSLVHYFLVGQYRCVSPSQWFDVAYYLQTQKDVARQCHEPLLHYLRHGGREARSPHPQFDGEWYTRQHPEVRSQGINPLLHYLENGHRAASPTRYAQDKQRRDDEGLCIEPDWQALRPLEPDGDPVVDIIVPVYKNRELTLRSIARVLEGEYTVAAELVVVNDSSPDRALVEELEELAEAGFFTYLCNSENLGFVRTVNKAMRLHPDRDVVLLNADTEVYNNWLDRLYATASRDEAVATVTPLSNNATICSYPRFLHDNPYPLETPYDELDRMAAEWNRGVSVLAPTGVGFCMYIRRAALDDVGYFDEKAFGRGYGEENDFCQQAILRGWVNRIAGDVFVRHVGAASFLGEREKQVARGLEVIDKRHPGYRKEVDAFIHRDPLALPRQNLDLARLQGFIREENVLMICHSRGGGAEKHLEEDVAAARAQGKGVFTLRPAPEGTSELSLQHPDCLELLNQPRLDLADCDRMVSILQRLGITEINEHGMVDFDPQAPVHLTRLVRALGVPLHLDIHDYKVICPRINLMDEAGMYCGEPDERTCNWCLASRKNSFGATDIGEWRRIHRQLLSQASAVVVPDEDVADRLRGYYADLAYTVVPHDDDFPVSASRLPRLDGNGVLHVVIIGAISQIKGFDVLLACARHGRTENLPIRFTVLGHSLNDRQLVNEGVAVTGRYRDDEAEALLRSLDPGFVWLPSTWPETYSYTLSIALATNFPVAAFDIGAIATRLRRKDRGQYLMPLEKARDPKHLTQQLLAWAQA